MRAVRSLCAQSLVAERALLAERLHYGDFTERRLSKVVLYVEYTADL